MSAITQRGKRKTAGKRMNDLVGKAQEQDDAFWGHDTWAEDDSGNESFHDSDEDSAIKKDVFDSDFDDSESDHDEEEREAGAEEERELKRQERSKSKGKGYMEAASKRPTKGKGRRVLGDGMNAGIVLNFPSSVGGKPLPTPAAAPLVPAATAAGVPPTKIPAAKKPTKRITMASTRAKRGSTINKRLRESTTKATAQSQSPTPPARKTLKTGTNKKSGKRVFTQEELLLEAVNKTEPENARWLLARKRLKDIEDQDREAMALRGKNKGPLIQKYHSKRGCLKTLTFPDMDSVPEILTRKKVVLKKPKETLCVITGKPARYRDPKTNLEYFDMAAFKELRRRLEAKEPLDQRKKAPPQPKSKPTTKQSPSSTQPKAKTTASKPATNGANPNNELAPSTPKPAVAVSGTNASGGPDLPALSPSGRRVSPRARKPSEKMREKIVSNPQLLSNLVKSGSNFPSNPSPTIPDDANTKSNSILPGPQTTTSPSNGNDKTSAMPRTASKQNVNTTTTTATTASVGAKAKRTKSPSSTKQKTTTTAAATKTKPAGSKQAAKATTAAGAKGKNTKTSPSTTKQKTTTAAATKTKPAGSKQAAKATTAAGAKGKNTKTSPSTTKQKTTTAAATKTKPAGSKQAAQATTAPAKPSGGNTKPAAEKVYPVPKESEATTKGPPYLTQSQLIMQVIEDFNKKHPEVKE